MTEGGIAEIRKACEAKKVRLPDGTMVPQLGQGTWYMGELTGRHKNELEALKMGIGLGMTLLDTAEMYGDGAAERTVGEAIRSFPREKLFLVSKVYPHNADRRRIFHSCEDSLRRMKVQTLDLYLLHWRGRVPLEETVSCMEELIRQGKIKRWGVSNFDTADMEDLWRTPGGQNCAVNQVLYHLGSRGIEFSLLPWMRTHKIPVMAYCPLAQGGRLRKGLLEHPAVREISEKYDITSEQVLLSFVLSHPDIIAIPKAGKPAHVQQNAAAVLYPLDQGDLAKLDAAFPPPDRKMHLDIV
ncbi:aldo/keto reductase [Marasmitruncus massiliensis]|uniref:aldo/keto reductase n=1 Tax=Marasmitruncus massiliensis TaxID=1944642 RepID=UPI000C7E3081|nr:aldo/keto reductase [Marasmitruncus massiliensis]